MAQVNDQVLAAIQLEYGINGQAPTADLKSTLETVVQASDFRVRYRVFDEAVTPGGGAGDVGFVYLADDRLDERWKIIQLEINNLTLDLAKVEILLKTLDGVAYTRVVMQGQVQAQSRLVMVGANGIGTSRFGTGNSRGEYPSEVWVPRGEDLTIAVRPDAGNFNQAIIELNALIEVHPPEVSSDLTEASQLIVPGP